MLEISRRSGSASGKEREIDVPSAKLECDTSLVGGLQRLVDRVARPTFGGDPLVRLKKFIEAAEKDTKSSGKDKRKQRLNARNDSSSGGSGSCGASAVGRRAAGEEEQDCLSQVGKNGKSFDDVFKKHEKQLPIKPEGLHTSHWRDTVVDMAEFISRVSTARTGDR